MSPDLDETWRGFLDAARREADRARAREDHEFPHYTEGAGWRLVSVEDRSRWLDDSRYEHGNWTAGFWFGVMWLLAMGAEHLEAAELARKRLPGLIRRADDSTTHDLGFLFHPSFAFASEAGFLDAAEAAPGIRAAEMLARRFNPRGGYLQAFGPIGDSRSAGTSTIDTMMNLPLLWWAAPKADPVLHDVARRHARTSARLFLRGDGSTYHLNRFDPISGALLARGTYQGATDHSCWSRGQSWAICGFAWAFAATGESEFLEAADRAAEYFLDRVPADGVPPWDFADPAPEAPRDASASAIAALGAGILGGVHPEEASRRRHAAIASDLLGRLSTSSLNRAGEQAGILLRCCYSKPHEMGMDSATAWGDYYFGLALALATKRVSLETMLGFVPRLPTSEARTSLEPRRHLHEDQKH